MKYDTSSQIKFEDDSFDSYDVMDIEFDDPLILISFGMENVISTYDCDLFEKCCNETSIEQELEETDLGYIKSNFKNSIKEHTRSVHERYYFGCTYCSDTFQREENLNTHMKRNHSQVTPLK